jgi:hypothetical protein
MLYALGVGNWQLVTPRCVRGCHLTGSGSRGSCAGVFGRCIYRKLQESYRNMTRTIVSSAPFGVVNSKVVTGAPL